MADYKKHKHDIRFYNYKDIGWRENADNIYKKQQVVKYTPNKDKAINKEFVIIETLITTESIVADYINELIDIVVLKYDFKTMIKKEINIGGEIDMIKKSHDELLRDEIDSTQPNSNDNYFNVLRPSIKIIEPIAVESF